MKVMCYVQHLMGTGHQWRVAAISRALRKLGVDVIYVSGGLPIPGLDPGCETFVQLPAVRADDMHYQTLVDEKGRPVDDGWKSRRRNVLLTAFARCQPDVLLIETFPFGRGLLRFELLPLLEAAYERRPRPRVVCSVRDVLEAKRRPGRNEEIVDLVDRYFDLVLVHSDPKFVPFDTTFPLAHQIEHKLRYTGYVKARDAPKPTSDLGSGEVIVSAGGGAFGEHVLRTAIEARPLSVLAKAPWRILVGPNLSPQRFANLQARADTGLVVERNRTDFPVLLRNCAVSVSQGGYNTMLEVLAAGARAVIVPYADEREQEQAVRARMLASHGLIEVVTDDALTPARLAQAIDAANSAPARQLSTIDMSGALTTARLVKNHFFGDVLLCAAGPHSITN